MKNLGDDIGLAMYKWASDLFPTCRSITGDGVRKTLHYLKTLVPSINIKSVPSGTKVFDWVVPKEWNIKSAFIKSRSGEILIDFNESNLHVMGYSIPVSRWIEIDELKNHLFSLPSRPNAIPYVTSYYKENWGFCLSHSQRINMTDPNYYVHIDSELTQGNLNYGEVIIEGNSKQEVFFSTYICHPSLANNELSGPVLATALAKYIHSLKDRRFSYRLIYIPETIGAITYLALNPTLKEDVAYGFNLTCVGDDRTFSFMPTRTGSTLTDKVCKYILRSEGICFDEYKFIDRGSDERQYCWPGIDLPVASIMRSKYGTYPEYHTSDDNLDLISPDGLFKSFDVYTKIIRAIEINQRYKVKILCEPFLSKRALYPTTSTLEPRGFSKKLLDFMVYCDGSNDVIDIANLINSPIDEIEAIVNTLLQNDLVSVD